MLEVRKILAVFCFALVSACVFMPKTASATFISGGGVAPSGGCNPGGIFPYWDSCNGVAWRYYPTTSNDVQMPGNANSPGTRVTGCGDLGGFYHLGYEVYNANGWEGRQMGSIDTRLVVPPYGTGIHNYASGVPGTVSWETAREHFEIAKAENGSNADWAQTSWFCFDSAWLEDDADKGRFVSRTVAIVPDAAGPEVVGIDTDGHDSPGFNGYKLSSKKFDSRIHISTDKEETRVIFRHRIDYNDALYDSHPDTTGVQHLRNVDYTAVENDICTDWEVRYTVGGESKPLPADQEGSGRLCTENKVDNKDKNVSSTREVIVRLAPGEQTTVCQTITYQPAKYSVAWERFDEWKNIGSSEHPNWVMYTDFTSKVEGSGKGRSRNCVRIRRAEDPEPSTNDEIITTKGSADNTVMFAGEGANVSWGSTAKSYAVRRLKSFQAILYQVPVAQDYKDQFGQDETRYTANISDDLCNYPGKFSLVTDCNRLHNVAVNSGTANKKYSGQPYTDEIDIVVSDNVGDKYCNTVGYKYEYWYNYRLGGEDNWTHENNRDYWFIPKSVCRSVAKKPSIAIWNGSLYSAGGIRALTAERYEKTMLANATVTDKTVNPTTLYGAWSEHLAVANEHLLKFGSGASLAIGSQDVSDFLKNSTLTIANKVDGADSLGYADISLKDTRKELWQRLGNSAVELSGEWAGEKLAANSKDTKIYHASGDLNITGDVENRNTYNDIGQIPQIIIFADGNVNIASSVSRIDAWIIANGRIDTCAKINNTIIGFQKGMIGVAGGTNPGTAASINNGPANKECAKQLIFNGPVVANEIYLNRTYGAEANANIGTNYNGADNSNAKYQPAEIFNYRADAYLWSYAKSGEFGSSLNQIYIKELPPRY